MGSVARKQFPFVESDENTLHLDGVWLWPIVRPPERFDEECAIVSEAADILNAWNDADALRARIEEMEGNDA